MNLCQPDSLKSCAACCGLYNVHDATRRSLEQKLTARTMAFAKTPRSPDALVEFEEAVRDAEGCVPLDPAIHVCEFTGFLDETRRIVGCMLHPSAPGNAGVDLRGLCHYGSMACKGFYCPACEEIPSHQQEIVRELVDDWHLYGLVATDVDLVTALFGLAEEVLGCGLELENINGRVRRALTDMLAWKDSWPFKAASTMRRSRYYFKGSMPERMKPVRQSMDALLESLSFTFDSELDRGAAEGYVRLNLERLAGEA